MTNSLKEWLVRTREGEVLGPYSQRELWDELQKKAFSLDDEIAPTQGQWISAQALGYRDADEFTRTSTRSQHFTRTSSQGPNENNKEDDHGVTSAHAIPPQSRAEDLTPTPDFESRPPHPQMSHPMNQPAPHARTKHQPHPAPRRNGSKIAPLITLLFLFAIAAAVISQMRNNPGQSKARNQVLGPVTSSGSSPMLKNVYDLIERGETKSALAELTRFHEKNTDKRDLEYLVPYSALLIMESDSPQRARKFLEQVLTSSSTPPAVKAQAHHWMGYLLLALAEGDMGESHFLDSLQINTKEVASRFELGRSYLLQSKYSQALDYFQLAELERPDLWLIHLFKGRAKLELGHYAEAKASFQKAILASPDRWVSYLYYAVVLADHGEKELAQATIKKMLTRDPLFEVNSPAPWGFYREKTDYEDYLKGFTKVMGDSLSEEKELGKLYLNYLNHGPQGPEGPKLEAVAVSSGTMAKVLALKVVLAREASLEELKVATGRLPNILSEFGYYAYILRGEARLRMGQITDAHADFKKSAELEPTSALAHFSLAVVNKRLHRTDEAQGEIRNVLTRHPTYIPAIVLSRTF